MRFIYMCNIVISVIIFGGTLLPFVEASQSLRSTITTSSSTTDEKEASLIKGLEGDENFKVGVEDLLARKEKDTKLRSSIGTTSTTTSQIDIVAEKTTSHQKVATTSSDSIVVDHRPPVVLEGRRQQQQRRRFLEDLQDEQRGYYSSSSNDEDDDEEGFPIDENLIKFGLFVLVVLGAYILFKIAFCIWGGKSANPAATLRIMHPSA